jgi:hypothetical protein
MTEKRESARTTVILAIATVVIGFFVVLYGLQTLIYFEAHHWASQEPFLKEVPGPLPTTAAAPAGAKGLSFYGLQFDVPWKEITKRTDGPAMSQLDFKSGAVLLFFNPDSQEDTVGNIRSGNAATYRKYANIFGTNIFPTNYDMYAAVYSASPASVSPFMHRQDAVRVSTLLLWKLAFGVNGAATIYSIQSGDKQGFQFGDPSLRPAVLVRLFNSHAQQIEMIFASKSGQAGTIPQAEINCVIDSVRPVLAQK